MRRRRAGGGISPRGRVPGRRAAGHPVREQLAVDQVATVSIRTTTALAILEDGTRSLVAQGIDRLVLVNAHGGNDFRPLVRDVRAMSGVLVVLANFYQMAPAELRSIFDEPGDHAGEMETSLLLHLCPEWVVMEQAGEGRTVPFAMKPPQAGSGRPGRGPQPIRTPGVAIHMAWPRRGQVPDAVCWSMTVLIVARASRGSPVPGLGARTSPADPGDGSIPR